MEQNDEWAVQRARYMTLETMATLSDDAIVGLPAAAASTRHRRRSSRWLRSYTTPRDMIAWALKAS